MSRTPTPAQREAVRQAAHWYVRLASAADNGEEQAQWQQWHDSDPLHRQAWQRMQTAGASFGGLPQRLATSTLLAAGHTRRQVLYGLALLLGGGAFASLGWRSDLRREWTADQRSAIGERREVRLADGSRLLLDTDSAVDVRFDGQQRQLLLHRGRILVETASDPAARPFSVATRFGRVLALGTRFTVAVDERDAQAAVLEKAVQVSLDSTRHLRLEAGQRVSFSAAGIGPVHDNDASVAAWQDGNLIAIALPLGELLTQLGRYRPGLLSCDPAVAQMRISGAFPLDDSDLALTALEASFPLVVRRRTRYWVTVTRRT